jgi:hypothetical protein
MATAAHIGYSSMHSRLRQPAASTIKLTIKLKVIVIKLKVIVNLRDDEV